MTRSRRSGHPPTEPVGLSHAVFLARITVAEAHSAHARLGQAAFLVLRLTDLLAPDRRDTVDPPAFQYMWQATKHYLDELREDVGREADLQELPSLDLLAESTREAFDAGPGRHLTNAFFAYVVYLRDRERHNEALDVLETEWMLAKTWPPGDRLDVAEDLAEYYARLRRVDDAEAVYRCLGRHASPDIRRRVRLGRAHLLHVAGRAEEAESRYRRIIAEAQRAGDTTVVLRAQLELARTLLERGRPAEALRDAWRAVAVGIPPPTRRWLALAAEVRIAARLGDRVSFERSRRLGELFHQDALPSPSVEVEFWIEVAVGLARFGSPAAARQALAAAQDVAARAGGTEAAFRVRAAEAQIAEGAIPRRLSAVRRTSAPRLNACSRVWSDCRTRTSWSRRCWRSGLPAQSQRDEASVAHGGGLAHCCMYILHAIHLIHATEAPLKGPGAGSGLSRSRGSRAARGACSADGLVPRRAVAPRPAPPRGRSAGGARPRLVVGAVGGGARRRSHATGGSGGSARRVSVWRRRPRELNARALIDTGALLAMANPRDQYHARAVESGRRFLAGGGRWVGTMLVLSELHGHLLHRRGAAVARGVVSALLDDAAYEWRDVPVSLVRAAITGWLERFRDQRFSLTDAVSFEVMRQERLTTAFAFDTDFLTAGFRLLS